MRAMLYSSNAGATPVHVRVIGLNARACRCTRREFLHIYKRLAIFMYSTPCAHIANRRIHTISAPSQSSFRTHDTQIFSLWRSILLTRCCCALLIRRALVLSQTIYDDRLENTIKIQWRPKSRVRLQLWRFTIIIWRHEMEQRALCWLFYEETTCVCVYVCVMLPNKNVSFSFCRARACISFYESQKDTTQLIAPLNLFSVRENPDSIEIYVG